MALAGNGRRGGFRLVLTLAAALGLLTALVAGAAADETTEATTFGTDGIASQSLGTHYEKIGFTSLIPRADGGLIALQENGRIVSYLSDGAPDPAVPPTKVSGGGGVFPVADGERLVVNRHKLTRVDADGSTDKDFGKAGSVTVPFGVHVAELPSGKIVVVSTEVIGPRTLTFHVSVTVLNRDGSRAGPDSSTSVPQSFSFGVREIALSGDGGELVIGNDFLLELRADGAVNQGFGTDGLVSGLPALAGAGVLPDGSVEAAASGASPGGNADLALLRLSAAGQPDTAFGPAGIRHFDFGADETAESASFAPDGSVFVGGRATAPGPCPEEACEEVPILAAFDPAGNLVSGFGQGGLVRLTAFAGLPQRYQAGGVTALARRPDGSIVAAGTSPPNESNGFLAAFTASGAPVSSFGEGGIARVREPLLASQDVVGFAPLPGGKLLAAATTDVGTEDHPVLIRYDADGSRDPSFGDGAGYVDTGQASFASAFAVGDDEAIIGTYGYPRSKLLMLRTDDGAPVPSFGEAGAVLLPRETKPVALAFAAGGDPVLLAGHPIPGTAEPGEVFRFRPDGTRDPTFGHRGKVELRLPGGGEVRGRALVSVPGGKFLVGGRAGRRFAITRLLPDGRSDPRFGSHGWAIVPAGGPAKYLTLGRAGSHIYLAGLVGGRVGGDLVLMRFDRNGHLERSFGRRGRLSTPLSRMEQPLKIVPTRRGVLVVLSGGLKPLVTFGRDGKVSERPVGTGPQFVEDVRATVVDGNLTVGWNRYVRSIGRQVYYLRRLPLAP
jgi:uncharacterized delta-60 repeat protein